MTRRPMILLAFLASLALALGGCSKKAPDIGDDVAAAGATGRALLTVVPADADFALILPDLESLGGDLQAMVERVSGDSNVDPLGDLLGALNIDAGVDRSGAMAVFLTDVSQMGPTGGPLFFLVPVTDYNEFLDGVGAEVEDPAQFQSPMDTTVYARRFGDYALISPDRDGIMAFDGEPSESMNGQLGELARDVFNRSDATLFINVETMRPIMQMGLETVFTQIESAQALLGDDAGNQMGWLLSLYGDGLGAVVRDSRLLTWGVEIDREIVASTGAIDLVPGSYLAQVWGPGAPAQALWETLPSRDFMVASASDLSGIDMADILERLIESLPDESTGIAGMFIEGMASYANVASASGIWFPQDGGASLAALTVVGTDSPEAFSASMTSYFERLNGQALNFGQMPIGPEAQLVDFTTTYQTQVERAITLPSGLTHDHLRWEITYPEGWEAAQGAELTAMLDAFGSREQDVYMAIHDGRVSMVSNGAPALLDELGSVTPGDSLAHHPAIAQAQAWRLRDGSDIEIVLNTAVAASWMLNFLDMAEGIEGVAPSSDLPPMAFFGDAAENTQAFRMVVPIADIAYFAQLVSSFENLH